MLQGKNSKQETLPYLAKENNFSKQVKENLLEWTGISSTVSIGKVHVRDAHRSKVDTSRCNICINYKRKYYQQNRAPWSMTDSSHIFGE